MRGASNKLIYSFMVRVIIPFFVYTGGNLRKYDLVKQWLWNKMKLVIYYGGRGA